MFLFDFLKAKKYNMCVKIVSLVDENQKQKHFKLKLLKLKFKSQDITKIEFETLKFRQKS